MPGWWPRLLAGLLFGLPGYCPASRLGLGVVDCQFDVQLDEARQPSSDGATLASDHSGAATRRRTSNPTFGVWLRLATSATTPPSSLHRSILSPLASLPCGLKFTQRTSTSATGLANSLLPVTGQRATTSSPLGSASPASGPGALLDRLELVPPRRSHCHALASPIDLPAPPSACSPTPSPHRLCCCASPALDSDVSTDGRALCGSMATCNDSTC
jgi:hypothetical protein